LEFTLFFLDFVKFKDLLIEMIDIPIVMMAATTNQKIFLMNKYFDFRQVIEFIKSFMLA
jgi:hypothetical protein